MKIDSTNVYFSSALTVYASSRDGIAAWWTTRTQSANPLGSVAQMQFPRSGFFAKLKVVALRCDSLVHWMCVDAEHPADTGFADLKDWIGTEVKFEIEPVSDSQTRFVFTHLGLGTLACNDVCRIIWSHCIGASPRSLVESGTGKPHQT